MKTELKQGDAQPLYNAVNAWNLIIIALCVWREARNQSFAGMMAVAWTIRNRSAHPSWMGKTWVEVVEHKYQYSSFNADDPNAHLLPGDVSTDATWSDALTAAERVFLNYGVDNTNGATHYYNPKAVSEPAWVKAPGTIFKVQIGDHLFYYAK